MYSAKKTVSKMFEQRLRQLSGSLLAKLPKITILGEQPFRYFTIAFLIVLVIAMLPVAFLVGGPVIFVLAVKDFFFNTDTNLFANESKGALGFFNILFLIFFIYLAAATGSFLFDFLREGSVCFSGRYVRASCQPFYSSAISNSILLAIYYAIFWVSLTISLGLIVSFFRKL
jgi:hypothetical protein